MAIHVEDNRECCMFHGQRRLSHASPSVSVTSLTPLSPRQTFILFNFSLINIVYYV